MKKNILTGLSIFMSFQLLHLTQAMAERKERTYSCSIHESSDSISLASRTVTLEDGTNAHVVTYETLRLRLETPCPSGCQFESNGFVISLTDWQGREIAWADSKTKASLTYEDLSATCKLL